MRSTPNAASEWLHRSPDRPISDLATEAIDRLLQ
jgi:hypothetical protein